MNMNTENYIIQKDERHPNIFKIHFFYKTQSTISLINSIVKTKIIKGATITDNYTSIQFKALTTETYNTFKERNKNSKIINCVNAVISLTTQLNYLLEKDHKIFIGYNPYDLLVINENSYIYLGCDNLLDITHTLPTQPPQLFITTPFTSQDFYFSPEMLKVKELPTYIHYKTCYFSLGCLFLYLLLDTNDFYTEYINENENNRYQKFQKFLDTLYFKDTKLYSFLSRTLMEDPKYRTLIFI